MDITIIVPTKNRTRFIKRQLEYYVKSNFTGFIYFGDASDDDIYKKNTEIISQFNSKLKIKHFHDKEKSSEQVTMELAKIVETEYMTLLPDDDLIITSAMVECINYLDKNDDYSAAHGKAYEMTIDYGKDNAFGKLTGVTPYRMVTENSDNPVERIKNFFEYVTNINMAIIRTRVSLGAYEACSGFDYYFSSLIFGELTHGSFVLSKGKIKEVNKAYLIRQVHDKQYFDAMNIIEWFGRSNWCDSYSILKSTIYENVLNNSSGSYDTDKKEIEFTISKYIKSLLESSGKANLLFKMKKNIIFNVFFRFYRSFKLHSQGKIKVNELGVDASDYINIIEQSRKTIT